MNDDDNLNKLSREIDMVQSAQARENDEKQDEMSVASRNWLAEATRSAWGLFGGAIVGSVGGYFLDRWLGTSPLFFISCFFLGFATGLYSLMREMGKNDK